MELRDMEAMRAMRFALRCQMICDEVEDMGCVPEGLEGAVDSLKQQVQNLKAMAMADFMERYEVKRRED